MTEFRRPELLDTSRHDRSGFDSGEGSLDEWLRRYSGQNRRRNTAATWVIVDEHEVIAAYCTLSMTCIDRSAAPAPLAHGASNPVPALLLGRLAVDRGHAGLGLGTAMVVHALATAVELNQRAVCRAVVVTALSEAVRRWWDRLGFVAFDPDDEGSLDLYLLTSDIDATLRTLR